MNNRSKHLTHEPFHDCSFSKSNQDYRQLVNRQFVIRLICIFTTIHFSILIVCFFYRQFVITLNIF